MAALLRKQKKLEKMAEYERQQQLLKEKMYFFILREGHKDSEKEEEESESSVYEDTLVFDTSVLILMLLSSLGHCSPLSPFPTSFYRNKRPSKPSKRTGRHS